MINIHDHNKRERKKTSNKTIETRHVLKERKKIANPGYFPLSNLFSIFKKTENKYSNLRSLIISNYQGYIFVGL